MHSKTVVVAISVICSVGGWFLWNIILSAAYNPTSKIYYVRNSFFNTFGRSLAWWLTLILIVCSVLIFEIGTSTLRSVFFTTDVDIFQALEKDPLVKRRFEEAASMELQQGWDRENSKRKRTSEEIRREEEELRKNEEEERREGEVKELLRNRVEELDVGGDGTAADDAGPNRRRSENVEEMLKRGFGRVRRE